MVLDEAWEDFEHDFELGLVDCFNHESLVVRQKEKASTFARAFASLEHLVAVELRQKTLLDHAKRHLIGLKKLAKLVELVVRDVSFGRN